MGVGAAIAGSAVVGAVASNSASKKQAKAAENAAEMQGDAAAQMRSDLSPYTQLGEQAINPLWAAMGYNFGVDNDAVRAAQTTLDKYMKSQAANPQWNQKKVQEQIATYKADIDAAKNTKVPLVNQNSALQQKFAFDPANLDQTPGYQFALQQGLKGTNNALASQGLGLSGAQAKGLSTFATGLADQTYGDQYNRALSTFNTNYQVAANNVNNLQGLVNTGQNSAAQTGQAGLQGANNAGNYLTQAGNAQAAGIAGVGQAANNAANNYMLYNALYKKPGA